MDKPVEDAELYLRDHPPSAGAILFLIKIAQSAITTQKARENALRRTAKYDPAKKFVIAEWAKNKGGCKSKEDFARLYARRVKQEFQIEVTERTIARGWLPRG